MSGKATILTGLAIFVAVFGALQADRYIHRRRSSDQVVDYMVPSPREIVPAALDQAEGTLDFRAAAKKVIPSVVSVDRYEHLQDWFGQDRGIAETGTGSGVIISASGLVVTNNHVVSSEQGQLASEVKVHLSDKRTFTAKVVGHDPLTDIAVLKIEGKDLAPIEIGTSGDLQIGQWVMAVGNPLGFDDTVSVGVVSSLKRDLPVGQVGIVNAIQTDAAINPGNSGGALTDQHGRLVGINAAIASPNGVGSVGIGFAIPVDRVRTVVNDIVAHGYARHASLGIGYSRQNEGVLSDEDTRDQLAQLTNSDASTVPTSGIIVLGASGSAARAGIGKFDVLISVDNTPTETQFDLNKILLMKNPGDHVQVKWWSHGQVKTASVVLQKTGGPIQ